MYVLRRGSLFWAASGVVGLFQARAVRRNDTYVPPVLLCGMNLARRRLTPDFIFYFSGGGIGCVSSETGFFIVSAHRLPNITLLTLIATLL